MEKRIPFSSTRWSGRSELGILRNGEAFAKNSEFCALSIVSLFLRTLPASR